MKIDIVKFHADFKLEANNLGSSNEEIIDLKNHFNGIAIPNEYIYFISEVSDAEILVQGELYIRIWGASGCIEMNDSYFIQKYIPDALAIGDDEGGQAIFYAKGNNGYGLYRVGFGNLDIADAVFISDSLYSLLIEGKGADELI